MGLVISHPEGSLKIEPNIRGAALKIGLRKLRVNVFVSLLACSAMAALAPHYRLFPLGLGALIGFVYANGFEYAYHRWFQHNGGPASMGHDEHHVHWRTDDEAAYVPLGSSVLLALVIVLNTLPFLAADRSWGWALAPGVACGFALYSVVSQELHWRIHVGTVPGFLQWCRRHHLRHHARDNSNYNVFLPLFDYLGGTLR